MGRNDILGCVGGRFFSMEIKSLTGKPSELQIYHQERVIANGGHSYIVNTFEKYESIIEALLLLPTLNESLNLPFD